MKKFYTDEYFDINFSSFSELSKSRIANDEFYSSFYEIFYEKYKSYDDLPALWQSQRNETVEHICEIVREEKKTKVLSIGCGTGFIECNLCHFLDDSDVTVDVTAIDPFVKIKQWCNNPSIKFKQGFFPNALDEKILFDLIYASAIEYVFDNEQYVSFLKSVVDYGVKDFLLTELSVQERLPLKHYLKDFQNWIFSFVGAFKYGQFWGYRRTINEHKAIFQKAGFQIIAIGRYKSGKYWIRAVVHNSQIS